MTSKKDHRSIERQTEIDASPDAVFRALTDAAELTRWFPPEAHVTPGPGGEIRLVWDGHWDGRCAIRAWEPGKRLVYTWMETTAPPDVHTGGAPAPLLVDFVIEGRSGGTVLRLTHSGFGPDADWDAMYDGVRRGWLFELSSLKYYLEKHAGESRRLVFVRRRPRLPRSDAWRAILGVGGLFDDQIAPDGLYPGERIRGRIGGSASVTGVVEIFSGPKDFAARLDQCNGALLRVHVDEYPAPEPLTEVYLSMSLWNVGAAESAEMERAVNHAADRLFPEEQCAPVGV